MSDVPLNMIAVLRLITWSPVSVYNTKQDETALSSYAARKWNEWTEKLI